MQDGRVHHVVIDSGLCIGCPDSYTGNYSPLSSTMVPPSDALLVCENARIDRKNNTSAVTRKFRSMMIVVLIYFLRGEQNHNEPANAILWLH